VGLSEGIEVKEEERKLMEVIERSADEGEEKSQEH